MISSLFHLARTARTGFVLAREGALALIDPSVLPPLARGLLPGVLRAELIATGRAIEGELTAADLAGGFLLGNSVRGLVSAVTVADSEAAAL